MILHNYYGIIKLKQRNLVKIGNRDFWHLTSAEAVKNVY